MKNIQEVNIKGKRVLMREDYNVPLEDGMIADDFRIRASLPTIKYLQQNGARVLILSHLGRPAGKAQPEFSLEIVAKHLCQLLGSEVLFFRNYNEAQHGVAEMRDGQVALYENLRFSFGEESADKEFSKKLALLGDLYINDAFGVSHRAHASVYILPKLLPAYAGLLLQQEILTFDRLRANAARPVTYIMGGAKVETKIRIIGKLINNIDAVCLGGLIANSIFAVRGISIGRSLYEPDIGQFIDGLDFNSDIFHLPQDVVAAKDLHGQTKSRISSIHDVHEDEFILDIGPKTIQLFESVIKNSKTVFWNGPMGLFEIPQYSLGTYELARALKGVKADIIIGGGEVTRAVQEVGAQKYVSYISTGGGAMLEYLADGTLPGIEALS